MKKIKPKAQQRRRGDAERMKDRVRHYMVLQDWSWATEPPPVPDAVSVGIVAQTRRRCSCDLCKPPRYDRVKARQDWKREVAAA